MENSFAFDVPILPSPAREPVDEEESSEERYSGDDNEASDRDQSMMEMEETELQTVADGATRQEVATRLKERISKQQKHSRHGIPLPPLPTTMIRKTVKTTSRSLGSGNARLNKEVLAAITQASDWFFEQLGEDLGAYADHARRKTIDESDMITLMRRSAPLELFWRLS